MTKTSNYKIWLKLVCENYEISKEEILSRKRDGLISEARHTFYWLCFRDKICLSRLSIELGKNRTTVWTTMKGKNTRNKKIEDKIWNYAGQRKNTELH